MICLYVILINHKFVEQELDNKKTTCNFNIIEYISFWKPVNKS